MTALMRSEGVVEAPIFLDQAFQLPLVQDQCMIHALTFQASNEPFTDRIRPRSLVGNRNDAYAFTPEEGIKSASEFTIIVVDQET